MTIKKTSIKTNTKSTANKRLSKKPKVITKMSVEQYINLLRERFGQSPKNWKVICPACKTIQSVQDLYSAGLPQVDSIFGYACIGRFTGKRKGCNYTVDEPSQLYTLVLIDNNGNEHPRFKIAPKDNNL